MGKTTDDLVNLLNIIVDRSHPEVPDQGYNTSFSRDWKDISFTTMDPHHWHLTEAVQKPQLGALDQIVSALPMKQNHALLSEQIRETLAAYRKISNLAKRVVGPVSLISDETLDENMNDVLATISEPNNAAVQDPN